MKRFVCIVILLMLGFYGIAQPPKSYSSSEILQNLKKLNVLGAVLYVAAHPDDENTRLLAYLANEKKLRTGYLSLTRGDGGQNLIGNEQGVELGLIRTQELLAARMVDGAEQFFTRAYDFGYSKSPEEAIRFWGQEQTLSDVVWVIRKFKPDVIIARFPTTGEGGHGHHTASAILAEEAFDAAADSTKFPEQFKYGVGPWQAKRLLWNTFNFGGTNTQNESQFKIDVGVFNPLLGKSYGEIAALSRSQHKSQGFGVPAQRGVQMEYFKTLKGAPPQADLMDGVETSWKRLVFDNNSEAVLNQLQTNIEIIIKEFDPNAPQKSVFDLVAVARQIAWVPDEYWRNQKMAAVQQLIELCGGLYMEAVTQSPFAVQGDSLRVNLIINNRQGLNLTSAKVTVFDTELSYKDIQKERNRNLTLTYKTVISKNATLTQPYWLEKPMDEGHFHVDKQEWIGMAQNEPLSVSFEVVVEGVPFVFKKPIRYKFTDPVKGELYQPLSIIPSFYIENYSGTVLKKIESPNRYTITPRISFKTSENFTRREVEGRFQPGNDLLSIPLFGSQTKSNLTVEPVIVDYPAQATEISFGENTLQKHTIEYDHIPNITYFSEAKIKLVQFADGLKIGGKKIGYISGAGDKIPEALTQMGYQVVNLNEADIQLDKISNLDAIVTGVRAYNTNEWMNDVYDVLMDYVKQGGVLVVQYNTSNQIGPVKAKISPYPFTISRGRITDEQAGVMFLLPNHPLLNTPNKITERDFEGWIQERSIYQAENADSNYQRILGMADPGEKQSNGSLISVDFGKGRFVYTGLVLFRQLPAGVPGAYRLLANLVTRPNWLRKEPLPIKRGNIKKGKQ